jgi:hypothetical protein
MARTVGNIRSDIDVARGDNAVEWRPQELEGFKCIQSIDISLVCGHFGLVFPIGISCRIAGLCIKNQLNKKTLLTLISHPRQFERCLVYLQLAFCLSKRLINLGVSISPRMSLAFTFAPISNAQDLR